jgi:hypothetical protein
VLIVEDRRPTGLAARTGWGFQTDEAADAKRRSGVSPVPAAIIVSDLVMPRAGGHDLLRL